MFNDIIKEKDLRDLIRKHIEDSMQLALDEVKKKNPDITYHDAIKKCIDDYTDEMVSAYTDFFSEDELRTLIEFHKSGIGEKLAQFTIQKLSPINSKILNDLFVVIFENEIDDENIRDSLVEEFQTNENIWST